METKIIAGMATLPEREKAFKEAIESLYHQVDEFHIGLNNYTEIPEWLEKLDKVKAYLLDNSKGDAAKFYKVGEVKGYYFAVDDDIIYPPTYTEKLIKALKKYDNKAIVGLHGVTLVGKVRSYYKNRTVNHCFNYLKSDKGVHIIATSSCAFHTSIIDMDFHDFAYPNMADIWLGVFAQEQNIPVKVLAHKKDYIKHSEHVDLKETIYEKHKNNDALQTKLVHTIRNWKVN